MEITKNLKMNDSVTAREDDWVRASLEAATDDNFFAVFRSNEAFRRVIEGTPKVGGVWILRRLLKNPFFCKAITLLQTSDTIGLPLQMIDFTLNKQHYSFSPTTLRYANNAANCIGFFGKEILGGDVEINEIGAGYGGECKVFNDFAQSINGSNLNKLWTVYDLPSSKGIITRFLKHFGYSANFADLASIPPKKLASSLVLSNGAFSEMRGDLLRTYFDKVIAPATFGYFITNFDTHSAPHGGWTTTDFLQRLHACGKTDAEELSVPAYLSYFDHQAGSKLIVFGHEAKSSTRHSNRDISRIRLMNFFELCFLKIERAFLGL